jgi:hypothetical protein
MQVSISIARLQTQPYELASVLAVTVSCLRSLFLASLVQQALLAWLLAAQFLLVVAAATADTLLSCIATVLNTGNVRLGSISITATGGSSCTPDNQPLLPNATTSCTITKAATQDSFEAGGMNLAFSASATPSGTNPSQVTSLDAVEVTLPVRRSMVLTLARSDTGSAILDKAGTAVQLTITASNTGNVHLHHITLTVTDLGELACNNHLGSDLLVGGDSLVCSGSFSFDQDALEAGSRNFSAAGSGSNLGGAGAASNVVEVVVAASPQLQVDVDALNCTRPARMRELLCCYLLNSEAPAVAICIRLQAAAMHLPQHTCFDERRSYTRAVCHLRWHAPTYTCFHITEVLCWYC